MSVVPPNRIKQALLDGQSVVGTLLLEIRQSGVMPLLANAGFDFVIIDNEHGMFNIETIVDLTRTGRHVGLTPIVRIPDVTYAYMAKTLDAGAQGIMIPRIVDAQQVRDAVQFMKYPPQGIRGNATGLASTDYKSEPVTDIMNQFNEETMLIVQIEHISAVENLEEIVTIPGVDVALIGPNDLAISMGIPGQMEAPPLQAAIERTIEVCQTHGVYPAIHIANPGLAVYWAGKGMRLLSSSAETTMLMKAGLEISSAIRQGFKASSTEATPQQKE
jgi:2-dehydro-3-deoxyglucarate aldolase/4-hydroxy-2-oxoheptanedioate aldolase